MHKKERITKKAALEKLGGIVKGDLFTTEGSKTIRVAERITKHGDVTELVRGKQMTYDPRYIDFVLRPEAWKFNVKNEGDEDTFLLD